MIKFKYLYLLAIMNFISNFEIKPDDPYYPHVHTFMPSENKNNKEDKDTVFFILRDEKNKLTLCYECGKHNDICYPFDIEEHKEIWAKLKKENTDQAFQAKKKYLIRLKEIKGFGRIQAKFLHANKEEISEKEYQELFS